MQVQHEVNSLLRVNRELAKAIDVAPRYDNGIIISLTLSEEAIGLLKSVSTNFTCDDFVGTIAGIKIYKK